MISVRDDLQVAQTIVLFVPIDVMNILVRKQLPTDSALNDDAMMFHIPPLTILSYASDAVSFWACPPSRV